MLDHFFSFMQKFLETPKRVVDFNKGLAKNVYTALHGEEKYKQYKATYEKIYNSARQAIYKKLKREFSDLPDQLLWKASKQGAKLLTVQVLQFENLEEQKLAFRRLFPLAYRDSRQWLVKWMESMYRRKAKTVSEQPVEVSN